VPLVGVLVLLLDRASLWSSFVSAEPSMLEERLLKEGWGLGWIREKSRV